MRPRWIASAIAFALAPAAPAAADPSAPAEASAPADAVPLGAEVIVIEEAPLPASTEVITSHDIATTPRRAADDLVRLVPGLYLSRHGAEGKAGHFFLRGFDALHGADLEVRVAGLSINEASNVHGHGYVDLGFVIPELITGVIARKGSFDVAQGNFATAGSLELSLAVPAHERGARLGYELGTTNRHRLLGVVAPEGAPEATFLAIEAMHDDGFGANRQSRRLVLLGQHRTELVGRGRLDLLVGGYGARFGEPAPIPLGPADGTDPARGGDDAHPPHGRSERLLTQLRWHDSGAHGTAELATHLQWRDLSLEQDYTGFLHYPELGDRRRQVHHALDAGLRARLERRRGPVALTAGADFLATRLRQREDQITSRGTPWQRNRDLAATQATAGVYAGARTALPGRLHLGAGVRADAFTFAGTDGLDAAPRHTETATAALSPRLELGWRATDHASVVAAYGRGLRSPEASAALAPEGDAAGVTTTDAAELGGRWHTARAAATLAGFWLHLGDELLFDHLSGTSVRRGPTTRLGLEAGLELRPHPWLEIGLDLTAVSARFDAGGELPGVPPLVGAARAAVHRGPWRTGAFAYGAGPRPLGHGATTGAQLVLDLLGAYRAPRWELALQVDNVLDAAWHEGAYHYASWFDRSQPRSALPRTHVVPGRPLGARLTFTAWL